MEIKDDFSKEEKQKILQLKKRKGGHYLSYLQKLRQKGWNTNPIEETVSAAIKKINNNIKSFVIYGEPQCGKTGMMVGLTSKLIEEGHELIIILLNDSVKLLKQNHDRFLESAIKPTALVATEVFENGFASGKNIIFCKKNIRDLKKLIISTKDKRKIIIDDEADYATPNAKVNKDERTAINKAIHKMINDDTTYIGVTATPARLDLNNTFETESEDWVYFKPHPGYVGKNDFFLTTENSYQRHNVTSNEKKDLEKAIIYFIVNATYLNLLNELNGRREENYGMLIHTSGKKIDHKTDAIIVRSVVEALSSRNHKNHQRMINIINDYISQREEIKEFDQEEVVNFIVDEVSSNKVVMMNSDYDTRDENTTPKAKYTFFIGGNVVSRGVTFDNLLGMFFTRSAKHNIQQDTYIQRARMFGSRKTYLKFFQLWISPELFSDWQRCFIFHYISLETLKETEMAPIWLSGGRVVPTAGPSIDRRNIFVSSGEVVSKKFLFLKHGDDLTNIINDKNTSELEKLKKIGGIVDEDFLKVIINFVVVTSGESSRNINFIPTRDVQEGSSYHDTLFRKVGIMGGEDYKNTNRDHHIMVIKNKKHEARIVYKYSPKRVRFFSKIGIQNVS